MSIFRKQGKPVDNCDLDAELNLSTVPFPIILSKKRSSQDKNEKDFLSHKVVTCPVLQQSTNEDKRCIEDSDLNDDTYPTFNSSYYLPRTERKAYKLSKGKRKMFHDGDSDLDKDNKYYSDLCSIFNYIPNSLKKILIPVKGKIERFQNSNSGGDDDTYKIFNCTKTAKSIKGEEEKFQGSTSGNYDDLYNAFLDSTSTCVTKTNKLYKFGKRNSLDFAQQTQRYFTALRGILNYGENEEVKIPVAETSFSSIAKNLEVEKAVIREISISAIIKNEEAEFSNPETLFCSFKNEEVEELIPETPFFPANELFRKRRSRLNSKRNRLLRSNYFKDRSGFYPENNHDVRILLQFPNYFLTRRFNFSKKWECEDLENLSEGVRQYLIEIECRPTQESVNSLLTKFNSRGRVIWTNKLTEELCKKLSDIEVIIDRIRSKSIRELYREDIKIDWLLVSSKYVSKYDEETCKNAWNCLCKPTISRTQFTDEECSNLLDVALKYDYQNWEQIALELQTNRSAYQCFIFYQRMKKVDKLKWTLEMDEALTRVVHNCTIAGNVYWPMVSTYFRDITYFQLYSRWKYRLNPDIKKGRFTIEESKKITDGLGNGKSLKELSSTLGNRTTIQIREHIRSRDTSRKVGPWDVNEVQLLLKLVKVNGYDWASISTHIEGRNRTQCRQKFKNIQKIYPDVLERDEIWLNYKLNEKVRPNEEEEEISRKKIKVEPLFESILKDWE